MSNTTEDRNPSRAVLEQALQQLRRLRARLDDVEQAQREPIAVIGAGCRFPGGIVDLDSYAEFLRKGSDAIQALPDRSDEAMLPMDGAVRWAGVIEGADLFDADFFGISPQEAARMDPQQRVALEVAWETFEHAGIVPERDPDTGVFIGVYNSDYLLLQVDAGLRPDVYTGPGGAHSIVANRISYAFDLSGPSIAVDTACSSSLAAIHLACQSLRQQECTLALAGGVNLILSRWSNDITSKVLPLAADGRCKSFDARADGIVRAEGCGLVLLKRLSKAVADGDRILAVIAGSAINQDGRSNGLTAPNLLAQQRVIRRALEQARMEPGDIGFIEAHGTGTALGDPIEVEALADVYGRTEDSAPLCAIGSVKANLGHLEAAAGIAALLKAVLAVRSGELYPQPNFESVNPNIRFEGSRMFVPRHAAAWPESSAPRGACVSSFGFGGTNVHMIVRQAANEIAGETTRAGNRVGEDTFHVLTLSAKTNAGLAAKANAFLRLLDRPEKQSGAAIASICYTASVRRSHHKHRLAVLGRPHELASLLKDRIALLAAGETKPTRNAGSRINAGLLFATGNAWDNAFVHRLLENPRLRACFETKRATTQNPSALTALQSAIVDWLSALAIVTHQAIVEAEFTKQGCNPVLAVGRPTATAALDLFPADVEPALFELDLYRRLFEAGFQLDWSTLYSAGGECADLPRQEWQHRRYWIEQHAPSRPAAAQPHATPAATAAQRPDFMTYLQRLIQDVVPDDEKQLVTLDQPLDALGLESLTVLDLRDRVERDFQVNIPLRLMLRGPSIRQIAAEVESQIQVSSSEARGLLDQVSAMKEDQVDQLLKKLMRAGNR